MFTIQDLEQNLENKISADYIDYIIERLDAHLSWLDKDFKSHSNYFITLKFSKEEILNALKMTKFQHLASEELDRAEWLEFGNLLLTETIDSTYDEHTAQLFKTIKELEIYLSK